MADNPNEDDQRKHASPSRNIPFAALLAAIFAVALYAISYSVMTTGVLRDPKSIERRYRSAAEARFFVPAAWIESKALRKTVEVNGYDPKSRRYDKLYYYQAEY